MTIIQQKDLIQSIADGLQFISYYHSPDFIQAMATAYENEESESAKDAIAQILYNSRLCAEGKRPICQDTGVAVVFVEVGMQVQWQNGDVPASISIDEMINEGVRQAYTLPSNKLRASVLSDPAGTRSNSKDNTPAIIHYKMVPGDQVSIKLAAKGGGSENKTKFACLLPSANIADWIISQVQTIGAGWCPPGILGIGIGGTPEKSMLLAKESLLAPVTMPQLLKKQKANEPLTRLEELRIEIYNKVNDLGIGAQGLGGKTTILDVNILDYPTHAASLPVAMIPNCVATRHTHFHLDGTGPAKFTPPSLDDYPDIIWKADEQSKSINLETLTQDEIQSWKPGQRLLLNGTILTARDAAHKKITELLEKNEPLPNGLSFKNKFVYYVGPVDPINEEVVGPAGPTTATRMDKYSKIMLEKSGIAGMIGKAERGDDTIGLIKQHQSVYLIAVGGAAFLISQAIKASKVIAFEDLGMEAVYEFTVEDMPVTVAVDSEGESVHKTGPLKWRKTSDKQTQNISTEAIKKKTLNNHIEKNDIEHDLKKVRLQLENVNQLKNNFLANMSHELRTPLNAIMGLLQLALKTNLSKTQASYIEKIEESSTQLSQMINDILDLSKVDSGKMTLSTSTFNLQTLLDELQKHFNVQATEKKLGLVLSIDPSISPLRYGDASKIKKVLMSLLQNALKFTDSGQVLLTITPGDSLPENSQQKNKSNQIIFNVIDTGIGLSEEQLKHLFIDFSQIDDSASRKYDGMGLGLNYSKKLVELMHGELKVKSKLHEGSHFSVILNLDEARKTQDNQSSPSEQIVEPPRILLAEDNKINQTIVKNLLEKNGCEVIVCDNGQQTVEQAKTEAYDLVLMDIQMPIMDGIEATQALRKDEGFKNLPIIALTGNTSEQEKTDCLDNGMNDFLSKPVKPKQLLDVLQKWIPGFQNNTSSSTKENNDKTILTAVEGINMSQGLQRLANNKSLYQQLLNDFCLHYKDYDERILELLKVTNYSEAERFAHSIKGVAGNIGAKTLSDAAGELEESIKIKIDTSAPYLKFSSALTQLHSNLASSGYGLHVENDRNQQASNSDKKLKPTDESIAILNKLQEKLSAYDGDSEDYMNGNLEVLNQAYPDDDIQQLSYAIQRFSFDDALLIVKKLLTS